MKIFSKSLLMIAVVTGITGVAVKSLGSKSIDAAQAKSDDVPPPPPGLFSTGGKDGAGQSVEEIVVLDTVSNSSIAVPAKITTPESSVQVVEEVQVEAVVLKPSDNAQELSISATPTGEDNDPLVMQENAPKASIPPVAPSIMHAQRKALASKVPCVTKQQPIAPKAPVASVQQPVVQFQPPAKPQFQVPQVQNQNFYGNNASGHMMPVAPVMPQGFNGHTNKNNQPSMQPMYPLTPPGTPVAPVPQYYQQGMNPPAANGMVLPPTGYVTPFNQKMGNMMMPPQLPVPPRQLNIPAFVPSENHDNTQGTKTSSSGN